MGPQHPMTHGLWTLKVKVDGETVVDTESDSDTSTEAWEKYEARDFTQITTYCDRLCYASEHMVTLLYLRRRGPTRCRGTREGRIFD